jgi:hypothetical protein
MSSHYIEEQKKIEENLYVFFLITHNVYFRGT